MSEQRYNSKMVGLPGAPDLDLSRPERSGRPLLFRKAAMPIQQFWSFSGYKEDQLTMIYTRFKKVLDKNKTKNPAGKFLLKDRTGIMITAKYKQLGLYRQYGG